MLQLNALRHIIIFFVSSNCHFCLPFIVQLEVDLFGDNQLVVLEHC